MKRKPVLQNCLVLGIQSDVYFYFISIFVSKGKDKN